MSHMHNFSFSLAMREDRYFIAGRAIAVSLKRGGPPAGFLSPTLFSSLVDGPELAKPVLEDIADSDHLMAFDSFPASLSIKTHVISDTEIFMNCSETWR